ncbi:MAG: CehA/McbA family metallohydrolase [Eubacteriales bacterium]|nr:CehA/McbA family metallohydrolase [Eubacteriales bacterium]
MTEERHIAVRIEKDQEGRYISVPFDLPERVAWFSVTYDYPHREEHPDGDWKISTTVNRIDLALVNPDGEQAGSSGAVRREVQIGGLAATPGYRPQTIQAGRWTIVAGAYRIEPDGVTVHYTIRWEKKTRAWFLGDLHTHTVASDGILTADELARHGRRHGLDFIAVTDHNNALPAAALPAVDGLTVIPGLEWTHYQGHANMLGLDRPYTGSFHANTRQEAVAHFTEARANGAVIVINHPCDPLYKFAFGLERFPYDMLEVWNGPMRESNVRAIAFWHQKLVSGEKIAACCGSDYHRDSIFQMLGGPCLAVLAWSREVKDLLEAAVLGHSYLVYGPDGPRLTMTCGQAVLGDTVAWNRDCRLDLYVERLQAGDSVRLIGPESVLATWQAEHAGSLKTSFAVTGPGFVRAEIHRAFAREVPVLPALVSNPIYFDRGDV